MWRRALPLLALLTLGIGAARHGSAASAVTGAAGSRAATPPAPQRVLLFEEYQALLDKHVTVISGPGEPFETRFNYEYFHDQRVRPVWTQKIRSEFLAVDPATLDPANRKAWAINFYNYLVLDGITEHLIIPGKKRQRYVSARDIRIDGAELWQIPMVTIDSVSYTLNSFRNHFLFEDFDSTLRKPPPPSLDPRIHFALVTGAIGGPAIQLRAFRADSLDQQLDRAVRLSLERPTYFRDDLANSRAGVPALCYWNRADFGGSLEQAARWLRPYLPRARRDKLDKLLGEGGCIYLQFDWGLDQLMNWRFQYDMDHPPRGTARRDST